MEHRKPYSGRVRLRYSITIKGINECSGSCAYCVAASTDMYKQGIDRNHIVEECRAIDKRTFEVAQFDFTALEHTLDTSKRYNKDALYTFDLWGADPLTCISSIAEVVYFIEDYCNTRGIRYSISSSTNGLPLLDPSVVQFIKEHHISVQLSHDGLGQKYRTGEYDPLKDKAIQALIKDGTVRTINATLTKQNCSPLDNIKYFNEILREIFPDVYDKDKVATEAESNIWRSIQIKLNHIYDGKYEGYDPTLTGRELDIYIHEWSMLFNVLFTPNIDNLYYRPYARYIKGQSNRYGFLKSFNSKGNPCRNFQIGIDEESEHLNTLGEYTQCNLVDKVVNPDNKLSEECETCKYKLSKECNMCGAMIKKDKCEYFYRWNMLLEEVHQRIELQHIQRRKNH